MAIDELASGYIRLSAAEKICFLAALSFDITLLVRGRYSNEPQLVRSEPDSLVGTLNELQNKVSSQLAAMTQGSLKRYPDDVFIQVLVERSSYGHCEKDLLWAMTKNIK